MLLLPMSTSKTQVIVQVVKQLSHENYYIWIIFLTHKQKAAAKDGGEKTKATGGGQQVL